MRLPAIHSIYTLEGPDGVVRYVGVSKDTKKRLWCHYTTQGKDALAEWLRQMRSDGSVVTMRVVDRTDECSLADAMVVERKWIAIHHDKGSPIFNPKPKTPTCPWTIVDSTKRPARRSVTA